jgi:hypothetical protein
LVFRITKPLSARALEGVNGRRARGAANVARRNPRANIQESFAESDAMDS